MDVLQALQQFEGLDSITIAGLILLGVVALVWSNIRGSNKIILAMSGTIAKQSEEHNMTQSAIQALGEQQQRHHDQRSISLTKNVAALTQVMETLGTLVTEVNGMRSDNAVINDLRDQLTALQATIQQQARQLEEQAIETTSLRESNAALLNNLNTEREAKAKLEVQLEKERNRNQKEVELLKAQINALQNDFLLYKQNAEKPNKEANLGDGLSQHPTKSDSANS